jgi:hypothetical protein
MKKLTLLLVLIFLSSAAAFAWGRNRAIRPENYIRYNPYSATQDKREAKEKSGKEVQFILEITGSDEDGYDIDAVNSTSEKWECTADFKLKGEDKADVEKAKEEKREPKSIEISKKRSFTVSGTGTGRFQADGEGGLDGKKLKILSFEVSCRQ